MKLTLLLLFLVGTAFGEGLTVHGVEIVVAKFHREDNRNHPYEETNTWKPYILPNNVKGDEPLVVKNKDNSYSIFFSTLDDLLKKVIEVSEKEKQKITQFNIEAHGIPGAMWFPKDQDELESVSCQDWKRVADASDDTSYDMYYSPISKSEVMYYHSLGDQQAQWACTTTSDVWKEKIQANPKFLDAIAPNMQMNFFSCLVGLGKVGESFLKELVLTFKAENITLRASTNFGLGDWSIPEGMAFWDYQNDTQIKHDYDNYPKAKKDRDFMQKGTIDMVQMVSGKPTATLLGNQDFISMFIKVLDVTHLSAFVPGAKEEIRLPTRIRIPKTNIFVEQK